MSAAGRRARQSPESRGANPQVARRAPDALAEFGRRTLPAYADWVRSWHENRDPERSVVVRYEEMLEDAAGVLRNVSRLFGLDASEETITRIVEEHSFARLSGGRDRGESGEKSFFRKGVAGDWRNHFTPELEAQYRESIGEFLEEFGYGW